MIARCRCVLLTHHRHPGDLLGRLRSNNTMQYGSDVANKLAQQKQKTINTTAKLACVGTVNQGERKFLHLWNQGSGNEIFWGIDSTIATTNLQSKACGSITDGQIVILPVGANINVYVLTASGTASLSILELS